MCDFPESDKPRIFVFVSDRPGVGWLLGMAIAEDGQLLAAHLSSSRDWLRYHLGLTSGLCHRSYRDHYSRGYKLVEVADDEVPGHQGLAEAIRRRQEAAEGGEIHE